ncbi:MAG: hypothetical protein GY711_27420 [bacterium]|nr:hypothetical protein [bacterium]
MRRFRVQPFLILSALVLAGSPALARQCEQRILASPNVMDANFGWSASMSQGTVMIGAYGGDALGSLSGAVYAYENAPSGWGQTDRLVPADSVADDYFGFDVVAQGDTVVIGSPRAHGPAARSGAAYVFERMPSGWVQTQKLVASDGGFDQFFGRAVALDGDTILVGSSEVAFRGAVYVFERGPGGWTETDKLLASDGIANDGFGSSVWIEGDTAMMGAAGDDDLGNVSGAAYVFERAGGVWGETQKLLASDGGSLHRYGNAIRIQGDRAMIAARTNAAGAVYAYERGPSGWVETQILVPSSPYTGEFGDALDLDGDRAVIGADSDSLLGFNAGAAYVFERTSDGTWVETSLFRDPEGGGSEFFGLSAAIEGETVVVGAHRTDEACPGVPSCDAGSALVFECVTSIGTRFCSPALDNSTGLPGVVFAAGSTGAFDDYLIVTAAQLPPGQFAMFVTGRDTDVIPIPGGGVLCLGNPFGRFNLVEQIFQGPSGSLRVDTIHMPVTPTVVLPGDTWHFQCWHRDVGGTASNLTDAVSVTFE